MGQVKPEGKRRTHRVAIVVRIEILGADANGRDFSEQARTVAISRHGATIVLGRKLVPGQQVTIRRVATQKEANAAVVGQIGGQPGSYVYGVASLDPSVNLWGIEFPPLAESEKGVVKLLLECTACDAREVVYLNELETEVFEGSRSLSRSCKHCAAWTVWKQTSRQLPAERPGAQADAVPQPSSAAEDRTQSIRKYVRVPVKMKACIRHPGFGEEVVKVENVSRGGLSFISSKGYLEGSRIEVAVPYAGGRANIFVAARIIRAQQLPAKRVTKYGAAYIKAHESLLGT